MTFPRIIHQTWKTSVIPEHLKAYVESWSRHNPDWQLRLWTDEDIRSLIERVEPDFLPVFDGYEKGVLKGDAFRPFVLLHEGGIYADLDMECHAPIDPLIARTDCFVGVEPATHWNYQQTRRRGLPFLLCNALMGSVPGHPFWRQVIDTMKVQAGADNVLDRTGPYLLTGAGLRAPRETRPSVVAAHVWSRVNVQGVPVAREEAAAPALNQQFDVVDIEGPALTTHHWLNGWVEGGKHQPHRSFVVRLRQKLSYLLHLNTRMGKLAYPADVVTLAAAHDENQPLMRILIGTPMKNTAKDLPRWRALIEALDYPPEQIGIAIVEGDSDDGTPARLDELAAAWQGRYREVVVRHYDSGFRSKRPRWHPKIQLKRRGIIAHCRNMILETAGDRYDAVFFVDGDLQELPPDALRQLIAAAQPVAMANCTLPDHVTPFDLNAFIYEMRPNGPKIARHLRGGLYQPPIGDERVYLTDVRYLDITPLDGVGGTALLVRCAVWQAGVRFPEKAYRFHIETEGFGIMARERGFNVVGLPNLIVTHPDSK